jgi:hypothetical protein
MIPDSCKTPAKLYVNGMRPSGQHECPHTEPGIVLCLLYRWQKLSWQLATFRVRASVGPLTNPGVPANPAGECGVAGKAGGEREKGGGGASGGAP